MKLVDLDAGFVSASTTDSTRIGVHFLCPKCRQQQLYIPINDTTARCNWGHSGDTIETLTLTPSVDARHVNFDDDLVAKPVECRWHGWISNGETRDA